MTDDYFDSEEFRELLEEYENSKTTGMPVFLDADDLTEIADYYQMQGKFDEADEAIDLALQKAPDGVQPLAYKIHESLSLGDIDAAEHYFSCISDTDAPEYIYSQAEILLAKGDVEEADKIFREGLKTIPADEYQDYVLDVVNIFNDFNCEEKSLLWMGLARYDDSSDFKELMARTLFGLGRYKDSEKLFNELIDRNPFSSQYWNALASSQFMQEDYNSAISSSEFAIAIDPSDPEAIMSKANSLYRIENYEAAYDYYRRYSELIPDDEFAMLHQGTCLINMGHFKEAEETLIQAIEICPDDSVYKPDIYQETAFAYSEQGFTDKAIEYLDMTDRMNCDHVQIMVIKGHVLLSAGKLDEAERVFAEAVNISPTPHTTLMRVIVSLYDNRYLTATYALFKQFFKMVDDNWNEGYSYMALCCWDLKKYDDFLHYLEIASTRNPREARQVLGHIFPDDVEPREYYHYIKQKLQN